jgi:hypothetical protein
VKADLMVEGRNAIRTDVGSFLNIRASMLDGTMGIDSLTYTTTEGEKNSFYEFDLPFWTDPITPGSRWMTSCRAASASRSTCTPQSPAARHRHTHGGLSTMTNNRNVIFDGGELCSPPKTSGSSPGCCSPSVTIGHTNVGAFTVEKGVLELPADPEVLPRAQHRPRPRAARRPRGPGDRDRRRYLRLVEDRGQRRG